MAIKNEPIRTHDDGCSSHISALISLSSSLNALVISEGIPSRPPNAPLPLVTPPAAVELAVSPRDCGQLPDFAAAATSLADCVRLALLGIPGRSYFWLKYRAAALGEDECRLISCTEPLALMYVIVAASCAASVGLDV